MRVHLCLNQDSCTCTLRSSTFRAPGFLSAALQLKALLTVHLPSFSFSFHKYQACTALRNLPHLKLLQAPLSLTVLSSHQSLAAQEILSWPLLPGGIKLCQNVVFIMKTKAMMFFKPHGFVIQKVHLQPQIIRDQQGNFTSWRQNKNLICVMKLSISQCFLCTEWGSARLFTSIVVKIKCHETIITN